MTIQKADIKIYKDAACTIEVGTTAEVNTYTEKYNDEKQLIDGQANIFTRYVKNVGQLSAPNISVIEVQDTNNYVTYSANQTSWSNTANLGEIKPGEVKPFYIQVFFPFGVPDKFNADGFYDVGNH